MEISLTYELCVFFMSVAVGMMEGVLFDLFKAFRIRVGFCAVAILDILYWFFASLCFFCLVFYSDGEIIRGFIFIALLLGLILYFSLFSKWVFFIINKAIYIFLRILKLFFKILLTPVAFLYKILIGVFYRLRLFYKLRNKNDKEEK